MGGQSALADTTPVYDGAAPVHPGQVLAGKFRVERIIGEGAMGLVVEATHLELEERVALKFLREEAKARPELASRFAREARSAATIKNDHVARVYDVGTHEGSPFIVMELLEGHDLEQVLAKKGKFDPTLAVEYVIEACEGLTAAHVKGIVHRDIKPGNLFLCEHGGLRQVKVLDFGISKAGVKKGTFEEIDLLTGDTTQIMGSPHYMSPEQIRSTKDVDLRADIWSLGIVLYELVANTPPFDAGEVTGLIAQVLHEPHRPVRTHSPDVSTGLEEVIDRCLAKDPKQRFQSAADLALALVPFAPKRSRAVAERAAGMQARATGAEAPPSLPPPAIPVTSKPVSAPVPAAAPSNSKWIAAAIMLVGFGGLGFAAFFRTPPPAPPEPPAPIAREAPRPVAAPTPVAEPIPVVSGVSSVAEAVPSIVPPPKPAAISPPVVHARPKPSASTTPANPDAEIRHER